MIEQERRDRELALRLAQGPEALDAEAEQAPQLPLQRFGYEHKILWGPLNWRTRTRTTIRVRVFRSEHAHKGLEADIFEVRVLRKEN